MHQNYISIFFPHHHSFTNNNLPLRHRAPFSFERAINSVNMDLESNDNQVRNLFCYQEGFGLTHSDLHCKTFLSAAWHGKNIHRFRLALLLNGTNPELVDEYSKMSIFEKCCLTREYSHIFSRCLQLKILFFAAQYSEFIRECIRWGCDVNKVKTFSGK